MDNQLNRLIENDRDRDDATPGQGGSAGKSTLTSRLSPTPQIVFRVADPETARALGESLSGGSRGRIQREADGAAGGRDANGVAAGAEVAVDRAASSTGAPLPTHLQRQFEGSLGADLSGVRVHTGGESATAAHAVGAKAYTVGQDIHFGAGKYQPDDPFGMHLLAHEVAHTVQQSGGAQRRQHKLEVSAPQDAAEHEADRAADAMVRGVSASVSGASGVARQVQRDKDGSAAPAADAQDAKKAETVATNWYLNFEDKPAGGTTSKVPARQTKDALYANLKIFPTAAHAAIRVDGVNAANHGQVFVRSVEHPKDTAGNFSADVKYGGKPSAKVNVGLTSTAASKEDSKLQKSIQAAINAKTTAMVKQATFDQGDSATIQSAVKAEADKVVASLAGDSAGHFSTTVSYTENPGKGEGYSLKEAAYTAIAKPAQCYAKVVVPSERITGSASGSKEANKGEAHEVADSDSSKSSSERSDADSRQEKAVQSVKSTIATALKSAWSNAKKNAKTTQTTLSGSAKETLQGELGGKLNATAAAKGLSLPLPGALGKVAKLLVDLTADIGAGGEISGKVGGGLEFTQGYTRQSTDVLTEEMLSSFDATISSNVETYTSNEIMTTVSQQIKDYFEEQKSHSQKDNTSASTKQTTTWSTTTVNFKVGDPMLTLSITQ